MADLVYNSFKKDVADGSIDMVNDTIKVMLVTSSYTPDIDAHTRRDDITNEVTGTAYVAGGVTITGITNTQDNALDEATIDAPNVTWAASTITARGAVVYKSTGVAANDNLVAYFDFSTDQISSSGDFTINWNALGILSIS